MQDRLVKQMVRMAKLTFFLAILVMLEAFILIYDGIQINHLKGIQQALVQFQSTQANFDKVVTDKLTK